MIFIALGANLPSIYGSPEETLHKSIEAIEARGIKILLRSSVWLSAPVPVSDQPWYRNAVIAVSTVLSPLSLMQELHSIESDFGRVRGMRNAARVLDLDLIAYGDDIVDEGVNIPHPRAHERAFVLRPLYEISPNWVHPVLKLGVGDLILSLPEGQGAVCAEKLVA